MVNIEYSFSVEVAKEYGVNEAILIKNFQFWILKNKANGKNFIDGHYWTFNTQKALEVLFPFWSVQSIKTTLKHLEEKGVIIKDNHNKVGFDKTCWYAFKDENVWLSHCFDPLVKINQSISENQPIDELELTNQYQIINKDSKQDNKEKLSKYGEFKNVCLEEEYYQKLKTTLGEKKLNFAIEKLDAWLDNPKQKNKRNANHRAYFKSNSWVWEGYVEESNPYSSFTAGFSKTATVKPHEDDLSWMED